MFLVIGTALCKGFGELDAVRIMFFARRPCAIVGLRDQSTPMQCKNYEINHKTKVYIYIYIHIYILIKPTLALRPTYPGARPYNHKTSGARP